MKKQQKTQPVKSEQINPSLQFIVLCDAVSTPDQRGKVSFIGIFDKFMRTGIIPHFTIAICWKNGRGDHKFKLRLLDPELNKVFETPEMKLHLKHETDSARADLNIDGMNFVKPGVFWVEVILNDETVQSVPLPVESGSNPQAVAKA